MKANHSQIGTDGGRAKAFPRHTGLLSNVVYQFAVLEICHADQR